MCQHSVLDQDKNFYLMSLSVPLTNFLDDAWKL